MKFKLDENFGNRTIQIFHSFGHEVHTVRSQGLQGSSDQKLFEICSSENLCLVTLDLDFSDVLRFEPQKSGGIVVIRVPRNPSLEVLVMLIKQFLEYLKENTLQNNLWIIEMGRIRMHQSE